MVRWNEGANHRFRSYDYCKKLFDRYYRQVLHGKQLSKRQKDYFALNLFCYLASWGMLRGRGWLLGRSYKFFIPLCDVIFDTKYKKLLKMDPLRGNYNANEVMDLYKALDEMIDSNLQKDELEDKSASKLMLCKIIMGTYGCVIAYDRFDCAGLETLGVHVNEQSSLTEDILNDTCRIITNPEYNFQSIIKTVEKDIRYTVFKILDMILWIEGERIEKEREQAKKKAQGK